MHMKSFTAPNALLWFAAHSPSPAQVAAKPNILIIAVDDRNHWGGYTGRNK
ncbi:MAG: hypothetical protein JWM59_920 [Verrucomicrobiales bacterium]|nr:hypothetical protein [Verrucomicrobiales bacterium]